MARLQERIDDAAEHLNATRKRIEAIREKLGQLKEATSTSGALLQDFNATQDSTLQGDGNQHNQQQEQEQEQDPQQQQQRQRREEERRRALAREEEEARRNKERGIRAFNLNTKKGIALIKDTCIRAPSAAAGRSNSSSSSSSIGISGFSAPGGAAAEAAPVFYPSLAAFLYGETASLNKRRLGEWLGEATNENARTLSNFARLFGEPFFRGTSLDQALRAYCRKVQLPTESQKLDRMMEAFAVAYVEQNGSGVDGAAASSRANPSAAGGAAPFRFSSVDAVHILSFSCVMLNYDTHHSASAAAATSKMSVAPSSSEESFIANHRGIDGGRDLPRPLLETLHRSIMAAPIETPLDEAVVRNPPPSPSSSGVLGGRSGGDGGGAILFTNPLRQGWLRKQGGSKTKSWAKRWFVLCDGTLFYFAAEGDIGQPKGCFPLADLAAKANKKQITLAPKNGKDFLKSAKFDRRGQMVIGNHRTLVLGALTENDAVMWVEVINSSATAPGKETSEEHPTDGSLQTVLGVSAMEMTQDAKR